MEKTKKHYIHSAFIHYLKEAQGNDYIKENEIKNIKKASK